MSPLFAPNGFRSALQNDNAATFGALLIDRPLDILRAAEVAFDGFRRLSDRSQFLIRDA